MRLHLVGGVLAFFGCGSTGNNPDYPPPVLPQPSLTVTEGATTTFLLGLVGGPLQGVVGGFYQGPSRCPTNSKVLLTPCEFDLSSPTEYPVTIAVTGTNDANDVVTVTAYLDGEIAEGSSHDFSVYVVDTDAPNVIASPWNVTLAASSSANFGVRLSQAPSDMLTVDLKLVSQDGSLQFEPPSLVFNTTDFDAIQPVMVTGTLTYSAEYVELVPSNGMPWGSVRVSAPFNDRPI